MDLTVCMFIGRTSLLKLRLGGVLQAVQKRGAIISMHRNELKRIKVTARTKIKESDVLQSLKA